ncbi:hypothetical protein TcCL_NonESM10143, partial [Trypanosoma cruzi]
MSPRAGSTLTHGGHRTAASAGHKLNAKGVPHTSIQWYRDSHRRQKRSCLAISALDAIQRPYVRQEHSCRPPCKYFFMCAGETGKKGGEAQGGTSTQQEAQLDDSDTCSTAPTSTITQGGGTHHPQKT